MRRFANKRAEGYIDVAVTIMIFAFALIFIVSRGLLLWRNVWVSSHTDFRWRIIRLMFGYKAL